MEKPIGNELEYEGHKLAKPLSNEMRILLSLSEGLRSEGWLADSWRFCKAMETNLIRAHLGVRALLEVREAHHELYDVLEDQIASMVFVARDIPLMIFDHTTKKAVPAMDGDRHIHVETVLMKQKVGSPSGIVITGELAGLIVETPDLTKIYTPETLSHVTASRLTYQPQLTDEGNTYRVLVDQLKLTDDLFNSKDADSLLNLVQGLVEKDTDIAIHEKYNKLVKSGANFLEILQQIANTYGVELDKKRFNYFIS